MHSSYARWTGALATAALIALPVAATAQTTPPATTPPPTTQTQTAPDPSGTPAQPQSSQDAAVNPASAKQHLSEARESLSQLAALPEAAKLQGDTRTQVSQLISNFNELITTQSDWRAAYAKLEANLVTLLGPENTDQAPATAASGVSGAVGTSGATGTATTGTTGTSGASAAPAAAGQLDPAIRAKLVDFRTHLKAFERSAGANTGTSGASAAPTTSAAPASTTPASTTPASTTPASAAPTGSGTTTGAMAPSPATGSSAAPANPATGATGSDPAAASASPSVMPNSPTGSMSQSDRSTAAAQVSHADADKQLDAISAILNQSKTGTLTKAQTAALKKHVAELRQLLQQSK